MKSTAKVRAKMVANIASKLGEGTSKGKRAVRAADGTDEIVGAAAVDAVGKQSRSLTSTGDLKGIFPGSATKEMVLSVAIADVLLSNAIYCD
jgi:hypothetical protein